MKKKVFMMAALLGLLVAPQKAQAAASVEFYLHQAFIRAIGTTSCRPVLYHLGDLDQSATVDEADIDILFSQWAQTGTGIASDLNRDGIVDAADYGILAEFYGYSCNN